jgi:hypothetical protein
MTQKSRTELQGLFQTGKKPSQQDFVDFIDSSLNIKDDGIEKPSGVNTPLKIKAQGTDEKLLDFYAGETKTWSINQKPDQDKIGLNISSSGSSKLFIESSRGNVGIGTTIPGAKLEISGDIKLQNGVAVNKISNDATLAGNSDLTITTEKAIKTYADTKALLAGSVTQDFTTKSLTVNGAIKVAVSNTVRFELGTNQKLSLGGNGSFEIDAPNVTAGRFVVTQEGNVGIGTGATTPGAKLEVKGDLKLQNGVAVNNISSDGTLKSNSDLTIPTEKAIKTYADTKALLAGSSTQDFTTKNLSVNSELTVNVDGAGAWNKFVVNTTSYWGDGTTKYVTIGAGGASGIMLFNPHITWQSSEKRASIRYGRSGGVSSGTYWDVGVREDKSFSFAINGNTDQKLSLSSTGDLTIFGNLSVIGKIQAQAVRQIISATNRIDTTSKTWVNMPDMSTTVITNNNPVLVLFKTGGVQCTGVTNDRARFRLLIDGVQKAFALHEFHNNGWELRDITLTCLETLTPASHTITVQWMAENATLTACWYNDTRSLTVVEL